VESAKNVNIGIAGINRELTRLAGFPLAHSLKGKESKMGLELFGGEKPPNRTLGQNREILIERFFRKVIIK